MPPVISDCPLDVESAVAVGAACTEVTWTAPSVIDDRETVIPILPQIMPGDCLPAGVYDVVYIYVDLSNQASSCSFRVTVTQLQGRQLLHTSKVEQNIQRYILRVGSTYFMIEKIG